MLASKYVVFVSNQLFLVCLNIKWELNVETTSCAFTDSFMLADMSRVKLTDVESVNRDVQNARILIKNLSSAVTNMYVPVKDADLFYIVELLLGYSCSNCNVVEEAEASN